MDRLGSDVAPAVFAWQVLVFELATYRSKHQICEHFHLFFSGTIDSQVYMYIFSARMLMKINVYMRIHMFIDGGQALKV